MTEELEEKLVTDLAGALADKSPDEIIAYLEQAGLTQEEIEEVMSVIGDLNDADSLTGDAQDMANEDNTEVTIKEEDKDNDGDIDKVTVKKEDAENDVFSDDELAEITSALENDDKGDEPHDKGLTGDTTLEEDLMLKPGMSPSEFSKTAAKKRGAKKGEPVPDLFSNKTNSIAKTLSSYRW